MLKKICTLLLLIGVPTLGIAQRYTERSYEIIGLADGDEIADALMVGLPLLLVGFLIAYIFMWGKSDEEKQKGEGSTMGCIGTILMGAGFLCLIPLLAWIEAIGVTVVFVVFVIVIICALWGWLTGK